LDHTRIERRFPLSLILTHTDGIGTVTVHLRLGDTVTSGRITTNMVADPAGIEIPTMTNGNREDHPRRTEHIVILRISTVHIRRGLPTGREETTTIVDNRGIGREIVAHVFIRSVPNNGRNTKAREYAAELERQIADRKRAEDRERSFRREPAFTGSNPIMGGSERNPTQMPKTSIRMSQGFGAGGGGESSLRGPIQTVPEHYQPQGAPPAGPTKSEYLRDLDAQIQFKRQKDEHEKHNLRLQDEKKDREIAEYNPWGRAGAGAPPAKKTDEPPPTQQSSAYPPALSAHHSYGPGTLGGPHNAAAGVGMAGYNYPPNPNGPVLFAGQQAALPPIADGESKFHRGQGSNMPNWEREELMKKQKVQSDHQESLRQQMAEREAEKARQIAIHKAEEQKEQDRIQREHDDLQKRYAREQEEARQKDEEARIANEKKSKERLAEQQARDRAFLDATEAAKKEKRSKRGERGDDGEH
ncbi:hypothetical protein HKX48_001067, partial [Thoreauomyces humboldtii]